MGSRRGLLFLALALVGLLILPLGGADVKALEKKGDVYQLVYSDHNPPMAPPCRAAVRWLTEIVSKKTNGKVQFKVITGGGLMTEAEVFRGVQSGIADMALYVVNARDGFVANMVVTLPFMGWPSREEANAIYRKLMEQYPEVKREWEGVVPFAYSMMPETHIHTVKKAKVVRTPEDVKKMKILTTGEHTNIVKAMGATPVEVPIGDWYTALERGVADGCLNHFAVLKVFGMLELLPHHTVFPGGVNMVPVGVIMNERTWKALPPEIQQVFVETQDEFTTYLYHVERTEWLEAAINFCREKGHTFVELSTADLVGWRNAVKAEVIDKWIAEAEAKGIPGKKLYEDTLKMIEAVQR